jgi:guanylate kinase
MIEDRKVRSLGSRVLFFDSSSKSSNDSKIDRLKRKIAKSGFDIVKGTGEHLAMDRPLDNIDAVVMYIGSEPDIASLSTLHFQNAHVPVICVYNDDRNKEMHKTISAIKKPNLRCFGLEELDSSKIDEISSLLEDATVIKKGSALMYDPVGNLADEANHFRREGIAVYSARTPEEFELQLKFHQGKIRAAIFDVDERTPQIISSTKPLGVKTIALIMPDQLQNDSVYKSVDYTVLKTKKGVFDNLQFRMFMEKLIPAVRITSKISLDTSNTIAKKTSVGRIIYIMGPSASGKTTVCKYINVLRPGSTQFSPKYSTRPLRIGEDQGSDILSISEEEFKAKEANNEFLHTYMKRGYGYAIHNSVLDYLRANKSVLITSTGFEQIGRFEEKVQAGLNDNVLMHVMLFSDRKTLEGRVNSSGASAEEVELRKKELDAEIASFDSSFNIFKYILFSHDSQYPLWNADRLAAALRWEEANPGMSYAETHKSYIDTITTILTGKRLGDLGSSASIDVSQSDISEFCSKIFREELEESLKSMFPIHAKWCGQSNFGRAGLFIEDKKRLSPAERNLVIDLIDHTLTKRGITSKLKDYHGSYHPRSLFGLVRADQGELCDGIAYSLTDEYSLHPPSHSPFSISFGFFKGCTEAGTILPMVQEEVFALSQDLPEGPIMNDELKHAVDKVKKGILYTSKN